MNIHFPAEFIDKIKNSVSILELASEYFTLEKINNELYRTNCKHTGGDKTPSLSFFTKTNSFYCFSCHAGRKDGETGGSDIICFIHWMEGLTWQESIIYLARRANIELPKKNLSKEDNEKIKLYNQALEENRVYWFNLERAPKIREYFHGRGFSDQDIDKYRLGAKWVKEVGEYRPVYSIIDEQGRTVGFSTRVDAKDTKYKNSTTSLIFKKKELIYGLNFIKKDIRQKDYIVIVEGQNDAMQLQKYGVPAGATMGTAIADGQINLIKKYTNNVIIFFDGDKPGEDKAISNGLALKEKGFNVWIAFSEGFDPDDVAKKYKEGIMDFIASVQIPVLSFIINRVITKGEREINKVRMNMFSELENIMSSVSDSLEKEIFYSEAKEKLLRGGI